MRGHAPAIALAFVLGCGADDEPADASPPRCDACVDATTADAAPDADEPSDASPDAPDAAVDPLLSDIRLVAAGAAHTCVQTGAGGTLRIACWGDNQFGQIGTGSRGLEPIPTPTPIPALDDEPVSEIALGGVHSCVRVGTGELRCWGGNTRGQIGIGAPTLSVPGPTRVRGVNAASVDAGGAHTCATRESAEALCWGAGDDGQLGAASTLDSPSPILLSVAMRPLIVRGGDYHTCALHGTGLVDCVGRDDQGQLGEGPMSPPIADATDLATGQHHTCVVRASGEVWCWGGNEDGQLGDGTTTSTPNRQRVDGLPSAARAIHARSDHTCALLDTDELWCWGQNDDGQSIPGGTVDQRTPASTGFDRIDAVALGRLHACVHREGRLSCWGSNDRGQLGDGTLEARIDAVMVVAAEVP